MVKVSFLIAAYNIENYIEKCLRSIMNQSLKEIEIIVVDDGSKDSTLSIIKKLSCSDSRIKYISQENKGIIEARKTGLKNASGEYVVFIDGDDWVSEDLAEKLYSLGKESNSDIVCYEYSLIYNNGKVLYQKDRIYENIASYKYLELILRQKIKHNLVIKFIKRAFIEKSSFYDI
ncbi:MAG: glycosyltransferase family 2 protein [Clostridium sp.]